MPIRQREAPEAFAIEGYRSGVFTRPQAAELLGLSRFEFNDLLFSQAATDSPTRLSYSTKGGTLAVVVISGSNRDNSGKCLHL
jgi:hypothetical protein